MCCAACFLMVGTAYLILFVDLRLSLNEHSHNTNMSMKGCYHEWGQTILRGLTVLSAESMHIFMHWFMYRIDTHTEWLWNIQCEWEG